jgi:hypothetical protein
MATCRLRQYTSRLRKKSFHVERVASAAKQVAGKIVEGANNSPQALKRGHTFNDLTSRVKLVPFPFRPSQKQFTDSSKKGNYLLD